MRTLQCFQFFFFFCPQKVEKTTPKSCILSAFGRVFFTAAPTAQTSPELHFRFINSFIQSSLLRSLDASFKSLWLHFNICSVHAKGLHAPRIRRETRYELFRFFIAIFHKEKKTNFYTHLYQKELKQGRLLHNTYLEPVSLNSNMLFTFNAVYPLHFIYSVFLDYFTYLQSLISNWHNWTPQLCITPQESFFFAFQLCYCTVCTM